MRRYRERTKKQKEIEEKAEEKEKQQRKERDIRRLQAQTFRKRLERQRKLMLCSGSIRVKKDYKAKADVAIQICARIKGYLGALKSAGTAQVTNTQHDKKVT